MYQKQLEEERSRQDVQDNSFRNRGPSVRGVRFALISTSI